MDTPLTQKDVVKAALKELFEEALADKRGPLYEAVLEVCEEVDFSALLKEARDTPRVSRDEVFGLMS